jgi:hypothetical protein
MGHLIIDAKPLTATDNRRRSAHQTRWRNCLDYLQFAAVTTTFMITCF